MRRILVDAARTRASWKRGGRAEHVDHFTGVNLDQFPATPAGVRAQVCALDDALSALNRRNTAGAGSIGNHSAFRLGEGLPVGDDLSSRRGRPSRPGGPAKAARCWPVPGRHLVHGDITTRPLARLEEMARDLATSF